MRHFYFRLVFGIIWLMATIISTVSGNLPFAGLYAVLGITFLYSSYSIWLKEKDKRR